MYIPECNFSLWVDFIERDFLENEFQSLVQRKIVNGATSNPAIFKQAILTSTAYKNQLSTLVHLSPKERYEALAITDIQRAADILRPLYDAGDDGYVSIEVDPFLCDDAAGTIAEGARLYNAIARPNVMIKIPATKAGYVAMEALTSTGIAVNATLVFSFEQAHQCLRAFRKGASKAPKVADTVISVFVSRIDRAIDVSLAEHKIHTALAGIYNASDIYVKAESFRVPKCRILFASTGVKGDALRPSYYVDKLIAPNTINTAPLETIRAFIARGDEMIKLPIDSSLIVDHFSRIAHAGISLNDVIHAQITEGLQAFKDAFSDILTTLENPS